MSDTKQDELPAEGATAGGDTEGTKGQEQGQEAAFTQADVDRIVKERIERERKRFADYDELKAKAGEKATAEERLAELEKRYEEAETRATRASIASEYGISAEDRDLFLTGSDEETLTAQAKRLADRESERKKRNNHVPNEGSNPSPPSDDRRDFVRRLTGRH